MELKEVAMPIQTNVTNKNLRVFSKEAMEKAISDAKFKELGGIPVVFRKPLDVKNISKYVTVDPKYQVGLAVDIDLEVMTATVQLFDRYGDELAKMISENLLSIQPRAIGKLNDKNEFDDIKIISYDIVEQQKGDVNND